MNVSLTRGSHTSSGELLDGPTQARTHQEAGLCTQLGTGRSNECSYAPEADAGEQHLGPPDPARTEASE